MKKSITFTQIIIVILALGIVGCLIYISTAQLSNREAALVSIILTILSVVASYITSQYFAEKGHKEALEEVKAQHIEEVQGVKATLYTLLKGGPGVRFKY
jgi:membrane protein implicated in regulation of membrane protease activity